MKPFANSQTPAQRQRQKAEQLVEAFWNGQLGVFEIEPTTLQAAEQGFNLPPVRIVLQGRVRVDIRDEDEQLIGDSPPNHKPRHAEDTTGAGEHRCLSRTAPLEKSTGRHLAACARIGHQDIALQPNTKRNPLPFKKSDPLGAEEFAISRKTANALPVNGTEKMFEEGDPFV